MKKSILLKLALVFFIAGSVAQQAHAILLSPKKKRILGTFFGLCAIDSFRVGSVLFSRGSDHKCCDNHSRGHSKTFWVQMFAFPGATFST